MRIIIYPFYYLVFNSKFSYAILQNKSDQDILLKYKIISKDKSCIIQGSGVDTNHFKNTRNDLTNIKKSFKLLFPSRLIYEKGFKELIIACNILWNSNYKFDLFLAGEIDAKSRSKIKSSDIHLFKKIQISNFLDILII